MFRKCTSLITLSFLFAVCALAQGLNTHASPNDWEEINFEFNSAVLSDGFPSLLRLADLLKNNPGYHVRVEGNTDNLGSQRYNERLGQQRADAVKAFLAHYGANPNQIEATTRGKTNPEVPGYKNRYSKTDVARWMNRRVVMTVTDQNGKVIGDGGMNQVLPAMTQAEPSKCCDDILKRLDKLDDIAKMLRDLADQNAGLRRDLDNLKQQEQALESKINGMPKPLTEQQTASVVDHRLEAFHDPRFSLLGLNVGADDRGRVTFTGSGRFFAPFKEHFAVQAQAEYLYFHDQKEGQFDIGLVNRIGTHFEGGLFASFKHVGLAGYGSGGTLGEGAAAFDYLFGWGKVGVFGTKGFLDNAILDTRNAVLEDGSIAPNLYIQRFLHITDQAGVNVTLGLWGKNYLEGNVGYLRAYSTGDRAGGTLRFIFPVASRLAFTAEGGINETMMPGPGTGQNARAVFGIQWGNLLRPKEFLESKYPVPMQVPRIRYEVVSRNIMKGASPPIADAGPDQIGVPAGTITLNGSNSHDPNGLPITFHWVQETGPAVALSAPTAAITTFTAAAGQAYGFRLTVTNSAGLSASARTRVTTTQAAAVAIDFFIANPSTIQIGQASTLQYKVQNATTVTISSIGTVNPSNGSLPVSPTVTTTYTLTASNGTSTQTATAVVTVTNPQVQILACTATPMNIMQGESATIVYATVNATSVSVNNGVGSVQPNGSFVVSPTATTSYVLTAMGAGGSTASCNVTVQVTPGTAPRIIRFTANPMTITSGATSTLVWQVENATTVSIAPTVGTVQLVGTADVTPTQTTTYTLTATNSFGTVTATATVTVTTGGGTPPPGQNVTISSFTANPPVSPSPGSPVVLTCIAANATSVTINGVGPVNSSGSVTVNPTQTTTYTCTAAGTGGPATATVTVTVTQTTPPPNQPPPVIVVGGLNGLSCSAPAVSSGSGGTYVCQTVVRQVTLDLSQSSSPSGATPLSYLTTSNNTSAAVLNPTSPQPTVQLGEQFGDYLFTVTVTDSKGNRSTATVDIQLVVTRVP